MNILQIILGFFQESEFYNDDDFDAVLKQLDTLQDTIQVQDTKEDKNTTTNISKNSEAAVRTGMLNSLDIKMLLDKLLT